MLLTKEKAKKLLNLLITDNDFSDICTELQRQIDGFTIDKGKMLQQMHCDHEWYKPTQEEADRVCLQYKADKDLSPAERIEFAMMVHDYCPKCGLSYRDRNLDIENLKRHFDESFRVALSFGRIGTYEAFQKAGDDFQTGLDKEIERLTEELKSLQEDYKKAKEKKERKKK